MPTMRAADLESLRTAGRRYYYRPSLALFRAFMLEEYVAAGLEFARPVVDLGCGDGSFGAALAERDMAMNADVAVDGSLQDLRSVPSTSPGQRIQADLTMLPLRTGSIGSIISNAVLSSLVTDDPDGVGRVLNEVHRTLRTGGMLVFTVALPSFNQNLLGTRLLRRFGVHQWTERYIRRVSRRHDHTLVFGESEWRGKLAAAGFRVEQARYFITLRQAKWYSWLHLVRGLDLLRRTNATGLRDLVGRGQATLLPALFGRFFRTEQNVPQEERRKNAGFALFVARKAPA
jgi:SAM-dependent methyltransferase